MASPSVSISSLFCTPGKEAGTFSLSTKVYDPTHRFRNWRLRLAHAYIAAGLGPKLPPPKDPHDATVRLLKIPNFTKVVPSRCYPGKVVKPMLPPLDARGLLERYKNHVWIENVPLERLSICKIGFKRLGVEELPEVFSVPLS